MRCANPSPVPADPTLSHGPASPASAPWRGRGRVPRPSGVAVVPSACGWRDSGWVGQNQGRGAWATSQRPFSLPHSRGPPTTPASFGVTHQVGKKDVSCDSRRGLQPAVGWPAASCVPDPGVGLGHGAGGPSPDSGRGAPGPPAAVRGGPRPTRLLSAHSVCPRLRARGLRCCGHTVQGPQATEQPGPCSRDGRRRRLVAVHGASLCPNPGHRPPHKASSSCLCSDRPSGSLLGARPDPRPRSSGPHGPGPWARGSRAKRPWPRGLGRPLRPAPPAHLPVPVSASPRGEWGPRPPGGCFAVDKPGHVRARRGPRAAGARGTCPSRGQRGAVLSLHGTVLGARARARAAGAGPALRPVPPAQEGGRSRSSPAPLLRESCRSPASRDAVWSRGPESRARPGPFTPRPPSMSPQRDPLRRAKTQAPQGHPTGGRPGDRGDRDWPHLPIPWKPGCRPRRGSRGRPGRGEALRSPLLTGFSSCHSPGTLAPSGPGRHPEAGALELAGGAVAGGRAVNAE